MAEINRFRSAIIKFIVSAENYRPVPAKKLAKMMAVEKRYYTDFQREIDSMFRDGSLVKLSSDRVALPDMPKKLTGVYRSNQRGFGFILPEDPNRHGDLFIPPGDNMGALNGDKVVAEVFNAGKRDGQMRFRGRVVEIVERAAGRFVGTLAKEATTTKWYVIPQGNALREPISVVDIPPGTSVGDKVVVEITHYPTERSAAAGVIVETLEAPTEAALAILSILREFEIPDDFPQAVTDQARQLSEGFDEDNIPAGREDLTKITTVTIDPDEARDFDDAISLETSGANVILGVHIADVSSFVRPGEPLDDEARLRGNSTYLPRHVSPMLPEILSNGLCSLQPDKLRWVKSAFIEYDGDGNVVSTRFANGVIRSARRLTYTQAQQIIDGKTGGYADNVVSTVCAMDTLAKKILARRRAAGMIHLDLPEAEIVFDDDGQPAGIEKADDSFTHRIIEMFMVEANEAVARLLDDKTPAFIRRIHPVSDGELGAQSSGLLRACGLKISGELSRKDIQALVKQVHGRPESYPVNLALLRTLEKAEYSIAPIGHYALASECYCHFTSPIRRYADLSVHRQLDDILRSQNDAHADDDYAAIARNCNMTEKRSVSAEREARMLITLMILREHIGEIADAVVTAVTASGFFAEILDYQVEGLIKLDDLPDGQRKWASDPKNGRITQTGSRNAIHIGQKVKVRIVAVDLAGRRLNLQAEDIGSESAKSSGPAKGKSPTGRKASGKKANSARKTKASDKSKGRRKKKRKN